MTATRSAARDTRRFDLEVGEERHEALPKRWLVYQVVRALVEKLAVRPEEVARLIKEIEGRSRPLWISASGELTEREFTPTVDADLVRYFTRDHELIHFDGRTYAFTNQWGETALQVAHGLTERFDALDAHIAESVREGSDGTDYLDRIYNALKAGKRQWRRGDNLLWAFGYVRRRQTAIDQINEELSERGMSTNPPITPDMPLDGYVTFYLHEDGDSEGSAGASGTVPTPIEVAPTVEPDELEELEDIETVADVPVTVANLDASENEPEWLPPDAQIEQALTVMEIKKYSQLVVQTTPRSIKGTVSYRSIARGLLTGKAVRVGDCLDDPALPHVRMDTPLLDVVEQFLLHDAVLVFRQDQSICGIVTPADIASEFGGMTAPFLLIGEVEKFLKWLIRKSITMDQVIEAIDGSSRPQPPRSVDDLSLGDIQRILERSDLWTQLGVWHDQKTVCSELNQIRTYRNAVMHFRERLAESQVRQIRAFVDLLRRMCESVG